MADMLARPPGTTSSQRACAFAFDQRLRGLVTYPGSIEQVTVALSAITAFFTCEQQPKPRARGASRRKSTYSLPLDRAARLRREAQSDPGSRQRASNAGRIRGLQDQQLSAQHGRSEMALNWRP
jgi:hypothetical protein